MRLNKYILALFLASSGALIAANYVAGGMHTSQANDKEKKNLGNAFYERMQTVETVSYPLMSLSGSEDGVPYGLRCTGVKDKAVSLSWNTPEATDGYFDDFESHDDFAVNSSGTIGWTYIDGDNKNTYSWSATNFKNQGQKMAFIIMNPSATTPSVEANPNYVPTSGKKMLATMCSINAPNNDWIISPELNFSEDFKFSFNARSYRTDGIDPERMRVGYSTGGKSQSSFTFVTPQPYLELPAEWKLYEYTIPKEAKYVCINCVSDDAFMMLIDDIFIGTNDVRPGIKPAFTGAKGIAANGIASNRLKGFNVYRDGKKVNQNLITEIRYTDIADTYTVHSYTVTAVYADGTESAQSQPVTVDVIDPALLPFEDDFDSWYLFPDRWTTPANPEGVDNMWSIDYYTYGLVDPAATYCYSSLKDFDQSLVSRSLRTLDRSNTYLRFETRLEVWKIYPDETCYLAVEISNDNGKTWETIDTYSNRNGEEYWKTHLYALKDYIKSDYFRLRWRCYGPTAMHLDYWYVDDVKVWNASFGQLRINVSDANGPVASTPVELIGTNGSKYSATTDASGNIAVGQAEADTYTVSIAKSGYNVHSSTIEVAPDRLNQYSVHLTRPEMKLSTTSILNEMNVEGKSQGSFTIENTGDGPLAWRMDYKPVKQSGKALDFEINKTWQGSGDLQTSIAFDGEYYYTTSWYYLGEFWKYDREGNLIEQFRIPDLYYKIYDLAYDGRYFYGSDLSNRIFQLDFENKRIAGTIEITSAPELQITHIAYNPNNDRFYVGGWNTLCEVRRNGRTSSLASPFDPDQTHYIYGSAYDNVTPGGPYLWLAAEESFNENMLDRVVIYQYNLSTKKFTGVKKAVTDLPGYKYGSATRGINYICGIEGSVDVVSGKYTLVGVLQQSPSLFFEYNVGETDTWLDYQPKKATLMPGEKATVNVQFDARNAEAGQTYSVAIPVNAIPEIASQTINLGFKATGESLTPRPKALTAKQGNRPEDVVLSWQQPSKAPASYNVYRNGKCIATGITATQYADNSLRRGTYKYEVTAIHAADGGSKESVKSDSVCYAVKIGAPYYAPLQLTASLSKNKDVSLQWLSPLAYSSESGTLSWSNGEHADQVGATSGGTFYAGSLWTADDLVLFRNKQITSASIRIVNPVKYLALCIFKDGERIVRKQFTDPITYGEWTTVDLDEPLTIQPGYDYTVAFLIDHAEGMQPLSIDASLEGDGRGNMLSMDGDYWFPATQMAIEGNFCIKFDVKAEGSVTEKAPIGYNVYRNDILVNSAPVTDTHFNDVLSTAGEYAYTVTSVYADGAAHNESAQCDAASVSVIDIGERHAPHTLQADVQANRLVSLGWGYPLAGASSFPVEALPHVTTDADHYPTYVSSFLANGTEMAVASDGVNIYTSVYNEDGRINQYDINGKYIDHFYINQLDGVRNLTYDGTDFWAADGNTYIYKVDLKNHVVLEQHNISEYARHLTYIPELDNGKGGFEVGDWDTSIYVTRRGAKIGDGPSFKGAAGTAYSNGKLYAFEQGNANAHTICIYDFKTNRRIGEIDLEQYAGLNETMTSLAGGMSTVHTKDGMTFLAANVQNSHAESEILFLDADGVKGVEGYNVYRDGTRLNDKTLTQRMFRETLAVEGEHKYQVETVYIDGTTSALSAPETVTILPTGTADAPTDVQALPASCGYDVALSFADPLLGTDVSRFEDFESQRPGTPAAISGWTNSADGWMASELHYHGSTGLSAARNTSADLTFPVDGYGWLSLFARADGSYPASLRVYTSADGTAPADFIILDDISLAETWREFSAMLPAGTRYVSLRTDGSGTVLLDAIRLNATAPQPHVWGYDIFRDDKKLNDAPVRNISYTDHNLLPGVYTYKVRQQSVTAAISPLSAPAVLDLNYSNGGQAPERLRVTGFSDSAVRLQWDAPAIGDVVNLKWHTGNSHDAAGLPNGGCFFAGVRWRTSDLADYAHLSLSQIEVYVNQVPDAMFILVYQGNTLMRRQYVAKLRQYSFNTIQLDEPLKIDATKEMRVVVYVEHNEITVPLGYDEGPARPGLGNLYSNDGITYTTMDNEETGIYGNWNITIGLKPYAPAAKGIIRTAVEAPATTERKFHIMIPTFDELVAMTAPAPQLAVSAAGTRAASDINTFEGYNVYANNMRVNDAPVFTTSYTDATNYMHYPYVQFKVSADYSLTGEAFSNTVIISTSGIDDVTTNSFSVGTRNGIIVVSGAKQGEHYQVLNAAGQQLASGIITSPMMSLTNTLPNGIYIVKIGSEHITVSL